MASLLSLRLTACILHKNGSTSPAVQISTGECLRAHTALKVVSHSSLFICALPTSGVRLHAQLTYSSTRCLIQKDKGGAPQRAKKEENVFCLFSQSTEQMFCLKATHGTLNTLLIYSIHEMRSQRLHLIRTAREQTHTLFPCN